MPSVRFCLVGLALGLAAAGGDRAVEERSFTAAVLEHTHVLGSSPDVTISLNLDLYQKAVEKAARLGAQLLVTPEYGITGYPGSDRIAWFAYAADVPEVTEPRVDLCARWSGGAAVPRIVGRLSCMAREHRLALVASVIDRKDCARSPSYPGCDGSRDGSLLFNTDVVFDSDGALLAKYHKANLWGEYAIDAASDCRAVTFTPRALNVSFGVFTCADLIHAWPALHLVRLGVRHFVMPLAWSNEMAQMQAEGWLQSWSRVANATLLAANARSRGTETGSGIFSRGEVWGCAQKRMERSPSLFDSR